MVANNTPFALPSLFIRKNPKKAIIVMHYRFQVFNSEIT